MNLQELNRINGIAGAVEFIEGRGGLPTAILHSTHAEAVVCLYGAQVLSYSPKGLRDLLWMSGNSEFQQGKPIRGGIPVCFPWFGPHVSDPKKPQHGFARLQLWTVAGASVYADGTVELRLSLSDNEETHALWPYAFAAEVVIRVGTDLDVTLRCTNTGTEAFTYTDALHSYFAVSDIGNVKISGLQGTEYYFGTATDSQPQQEEHLKIRQEENRRYIETSADCVIHDAAVPGPIRVAKRGSRVTVVWNPWKETAKQISDMPDEGYKTMICVEAVNAYGDAVTLQPGATFNLGTTIIAMQ
ncbi:MAG TPA: D-hexose-6-phosphate mutarotase [Bacteroidota bacterium]|nr:D-hexose-6-phosphate mutarotase [Bacteroidota bacterium]